MDNPPLGCVREEQKEYLLRKKTAGRSMDLWWLRMDRVFGRGAFQFVTLEAGNIPPQLEGKYNPDATKSTLIAFQDESGTIIFLDKQGQAQYTITPQGTLIQCGVTPWQGKELQDDMPSFFGHDVWGLENKGFINVRGEKRFKTDAEVQTGGTSIITDEDGYKLIDTTSEETMPKLVTKFKDNQNIKVFKNDTGDYRIYVREDVEGSFTLTPIDLKTESVRGFMHLAPSQNEESQLAAVRLLSQLVTQGSDPKRFTRSDMRHVADVMKGVVSFIECMEPEKQRRLKVKRDFANQIIHSAKRYLY